MTHGSSHKPVQKPADALGRSGRKRSWLRWLGILLTTIAFLYLLRILISGNIFSGFQSITFKPYQLGAIFILYLLALVLQFLVWLTFASAYREIDWEDVQIFARTIFMRRLPGGFWHWVGRTALYAFDEKLDEKQVIHGNFFEWGIQLLTGVVGLVWLAPEISISLSSVISLLAFLLGLRLLNAWLPSNKPLRLAITRVILLIMLYGLIWLISTLIFRAVLTMVPAEQIGLGTTARIWLLGGLSGVLTIPLPATFGIQEAVLAIQLQNYLSPQAAVLTAILLRAIYIVSDLLWGLVGWGLSRIAIYRSQ